MDKFSIVYKELEHKQPKLIFLSGKTSTGKTTLANMLLQKYDAKVIELDRIVRAISAPLDIDKFVAIYRHRDEKTLVETFVLSVRREIDDALKSQRMVLLDGALANSETLKEIVNGWTDSFLFIYLEPTNLDLYVERLTSRFKLASLGDNSGLPSSFWEHFMKDELETYFTTRKITPDINRAIRAYAEVSAGESVTRLKNFKNTFDGIVVVEV